MKYKFNDNKHWLKGIAALLVIVFFSIHTISSMQDPYLNAFTKAINIVILVAVIVLAGYKATYYFKLSKQHYIILEDHFLSIYRGNLLSRKTIPYTEVNSVVQIEEDLYLKLKKGKEEAIYLNRLSKEDSVEIKTKLKNRFDFKHIV
ncbi:YdbT family protein [Sutcliffiella deserti]|uniref:hypothetical protein n=1 Tax=Sutcliffiella deserti TaxID=2875501 RepID=UPI001CBE6508|nr:hypothetical protein [Sutcliffiella deserti]